MYLTRAIVTAAAFLLLIVAAPSFSADSGPAVWASAADDDTDTGSEVCALRDTPPQYFLPERLCVAVFVPGSDEAHSCGEDMTGQGVPSGDWFLVLCK